MQIMKRTLPKYILLNCLTLGIYGVITLSKMGNEIDAICAGDNEKPRFGFFAALALGWLTFGLYHRYWWYKQANRLKLNANRYGLVVKESGIDAFLFRTAAEPMFAPFTAILIGLSGILPFLITLLCSYIDPVFGIVMGFLFSVPAALLVSEMTTGAYMSVYFVMKNLNRFSDVYRKDAAPFDPMAYPYYPSKDNFYLKYMAPLVKGNMVSTMPAKKKEADSFGFDEEDTGPLSSISTGSIIGINGPCAGYNFNINTGEEIVIGKDAQVSSVVIDTAYKEISRKHVGVSYDIIRDVYRVVDYSSNGTWANGQKLTPGVEALLPRKTVLKLANDKNTFMLG